MYLDIFFLLAICLLLTLFGMAVVFGWFRFRSLFCQHRDESLEFVRNIYGDEINHYAGKRSIWHCKSCDSNVYKDTLFKGKPQGPRFSGGIYK